MYRLYAIALICLPLLAAALPAHAQEADIHKALVLLRAGHREQAAQSLSALEKTKRDDPAVLYLRAALTEDAETAIGIYQRIVNEHPGSGWADDALYRLYQYSYAVGAYRTARQYQDRLRTEYPRSPFLSRDAERPEGDPAPSGGSAADNSGAASNDRNPAAGQGTAGQRTSASSPVAYSIQVGAFSGRADAEKHLKQLKDRHGYTLEVREKMSADKKVYAVWLGRFDDMEQARSYMKRIKDKYGIDGILVRR